MVLPACFKMTVNSKCGKQHRIWATKMLKVKLLN
jgi:hypothetical protein